MTSDGVLILIVGLVAGFGLGYVTAWYAQERQRKER